MALLDQHPHSEMKLRSRRWWRVWFLVVFLLTGCTGVPAIRPSGDILLPSSHSSERNVSVVSNGFHTALVVARGDLPARHIPELADFPDARFLEFSWGDAEYFPADEETIAIALRAAFLPTDAVMHIVPLRRTPVERYPSAEIVRLSFNETGFARLVRYLGASFDRNKENTALPGLYQDSRFYPATGRFHLGNTCNSWTARGLALAGVKLDVSASASAEGLMDQLRSAD